MGLDIKGVDINAQDIRVTPKDIKSRTQLILDAHKNLSGDELQYLKDRGLTQQTIDKFKDM